MRRLCCVVLLLVAAAASGVHSQQQHEHLPILGGYSNVDVDTDIIKEMASFATTTVSQAINSQEPLTVVRIVSAKSQVVAGVNYQMELELKEGENDAIFCKVVVYDQSWTSTRRVTDCSCCGSSWAVADDRPVLVTTPLPVLHVEPLPTLNIAHHPADEETSHHSHQHHETTPSSSSITNKFDFFLLAFCAALMMPVFTN